MAIQTADGQQWHGFEITTEDVANVLAKNKLAGDPQEILNSFTLSDFQKVCAGAEGDVEEMTQSVLIGITELLKQRG